MEIPINKHKVAGVVSEINQILGGKEFTYVDILLGTAEFMGRIIVDRAENHQQTLEMVKVINDHMATTISVGNVARSKSLVPPKG